MKGPLDRPGLVLEDLWLAFGRKTAVKGVTAWCGVGVSAVVGPNGSGKSCLLRMAAGIVRPTRGRVFWLGVDAAGDPFFLKDALGYLPQRPVPYPDMTPRQFLSHMATLKAIPRHLAGARRDHLLAELGLARVADVPAHRLSHGQRARLGLAQALLNDPYLLILDEPTKGQAPESRLEILALIRRLAETRVVVMATNELSDVDVDRDRLLCLEEGRLVFQGPAADLVDRARVSGGARRAEVCLAEAYLRLRRSLATAGKKRPEPA